MHKGSLPQVPLARLALFGEQVALERVILANLARTGYFKGLLRTAVRLHLGHGLERRIFLRDGKSRLFSSKCKMKFAPANAPQQLRLPLRPFYPFP